MCYVRDDVGFGFGGTCECGWMLLLLNLLFFFEREIFLNGVSWLIDWLVVFCWNKFVLELKIFEKKNDGYICWLRKKQVLRIMNRLNLNDTNNHKSNMLLSLFVGDDYFVLKTEGDLM